MRDQCSCLTANQADKSKYLHELGNHALVSAQVGGNYDGSMLISSELLKALRTPQGVAIPGNTLAESPARHGPTSLRQAVSSP
jgi:hypothetical protein